MAKKPKITIETLNAALDTPTVRAALRAKARRVLPRAQRIAYAAGSPEFAEALHLGEGTRPGAKSDGGLKRPYARITADVTEEMKLRDGRPTPTRRTILRQSARA